MSYVESSYSLSEAATIAAPFHMNSRLSSVERQTFPLFMPDGVNIDKLLRAQTAFVLDAGAYLAEVIRGGLQAVPRGREAGSVKSAERYRMSALRTPDWTAKRTCVLALP